MKRNWFAPCVALVLAVLVMSGCGTQFTVGEGIVTVDGLAAGQLVLCGANNEVLQITGSGFLSEHGNEVIVEFTALQGTPFNGQPSEQVVGIALSDGLVESLLPSVTGATELTVTIILPGSNFGVSPPETIQLGGSLVGPFANFDSITDATGNVTYNVGAPGVLENDTPSFCADEDEDELELKPRPAPGSPSHTLLLQNLSVAIPPAGFEDDATPGLLKMTTAMPASGERGTVLIQPDGSFVYEPPLGYEGADGFYYWVQETGRPDPSRAFVSITVSKVVWFIRDTALNPGVSLLGTGRFSDPFDSLAGFNSVQNAPPVTNPFAFPPTQPIPPNPDNAPQEGDCIFIYENVITTEYDEGIRLRDRQRLIGEGVGLFLNNTQIVSPGTGPFPNPVLTNSGVRLGEVQIFLPVVTLANENEIRGIDIDEPAAGGTYGDGIFGFEVSGPTIIDSVRIMNAVGSGISLQGILAGTIQVGDPALPGFPRVEIIDVGNRGIEMYGPNSFTSDINAVAGGATLDVFQTLIDDPDFIGIEAADVNLAVDQCEIDGYGSPSFGADYGISMTNFFTGATCTCDITNTAIGRLAEQDGDIGVTIIPLVTGDEIVATIRNCLIRSPWAAVGLGPPFGSSGSGRLFLEMDDNTFERTTAVQSPEQTIPFLNPTVWVRGGDTRETYITTMDDNYVIGNGIGGGALFQYVTFDADANPGNGIQETQATGNTRFGQGTLDGDRVVDTSLVFEECVGDLRFETLNIFQLGGDLTGFEVVTSGVLNLAFINAPNVDVSP